MKHVATEFGEEVGDYLAGLYPHGPFCNSQMDQITHSIYMKRKHSKDILYTKYS